MSDRRKQIKDAASRHLCDNCHHEWCSAESFVSGCEWADENPKYKWDFSLLEVEDKLNIAVEALEKIIDQGTEDWEATSVMYASLALKKIKDSQGGGGLNG